jgi:hypothetical protein
MQYKSPLLQSLQSNLRLQHLSRRTEAAYVYWTKRFVRFCGLRHPSELGPAEVRQFLSHLVVERNLSAAAQQQALSALLFQRGSWDCSGASIAWWACCCMAAGFG